MVVVRYRWVWEDYENCQDGRNLGIMDPRIEWVRHSIKEIGLNGGRILRRKGKCWKKCKEVGPRKDSHQPRDGGDIASLMDKGKLKGRLDEGKKKGNGGSWRKGSLGVLLQKNGPNVTFGP